MIRNTPYNCRSAFDNTEKHRLTTKIKVVFKFVLPPLNQKTTVKLRISEEFMPEALTFI
jgi:hypothetical protein